MKRLRAALTFGSLALATAIGCSSSVADPDSETHWLRKCNADSDCGQGLSCLCNTCTRSCGKSDCKSLDASATCVTPPAEALSDACQLAPGIALCARACSKDADCTAAGLRCIGGACLNGSQAAPVTSVARDGGADSSTPDTGASEPTSPSTWVKDLIAANCRREIRCGHYPDGATCTAAAPKYFVTDGFNTASAAVTAVGKGTAQFHAADATTCLTALSNLDCSFDAWSLPSIPGPCATVFSGTVPDGAACIDDVECASGAPCVVASTTTCEGTCNPSSGACRMDTDCPANQYCDGVPWQGPGFWRSGACNPIVPPGAAAGDVCGMPVPCATGLNCFGGPAPARCEPPGGVGVGEACGTEPASNLPGCATGLACITSDDGTTQTCMPEAKLGDPCTSLFQCGAQYLFNDLICDVNGTHTCVRRPSTGPCVLVQGINSCDPTVGFCDGAPGAAMCKPWLSLGEECVVPTQGIDPCGPSASCQGTTSAHCTSIVAPVCTPK